MTSITGLIGMDRVIEPREHPMDEAPLFLLPLGMGGDDEVTMMVRAAADDVTGGNCTFVDDDLLILQHLAARAVSAGLIDGLNPSIQAKLCGKVKARPDFAHPKPSPQLAE